MLLAYLITLATPLGILLLLYSLDTFGIQPRRYVIQALVWGGVAFGLAFLVESASSAAYGRVMLALMIAPFLEEALKAAHLYVQMSRGRLINAVDGLSIGFEIGISFGIVENLVYLTLFGGSGQEALGFAAARVLTSGLMHAVAAGMVGAVAGHAVRYRTRHQRLVFFAALLIAMSFHLAFNLVALRLDGSWLVLIALSISLAGLAIMVFIVRREVGRVSQQVMQLGGDISAGARIAASDPQALRRALAKYQSALGDDILTKIELYARLTGQQTLLRAASDSLGPSRYRAAVDARLRHVDGQLAVLNADIGLFMRVWMSMVVADDEDLRSALALTELPVKEDPLLNLALQLANRTAALDESEVEERKHALAHSHLFNGLKGTDLEDVALMLDRHDVAVGDVLLVRDEPNERMFLVASGKFELQIPRMDGALTSMGLVYPGGVFGLVSVLGDQQVTSNVVCIEPGVVYIIDRRSLLSLVYGNPRIALVLLNHLALRVQEWGELIQQLSQATALESLVVGDS